MTPSWQLLALAPSSPSRPMRHLGVRLPQKPARPPEESLNLDAQQRQFVTDELADVATYLLRLAAVVDVDLLQAVTEKIERNEQRYPAE